MLPIKLKAGFEISKDYKLTEVINAHNYIYEDVRKDVKVSTFEISPDSYIIPRDLTKLQKSLRVKVKIKDERVTNETNFELSDDFSLRDYQKSSSDKLIELLKNSKVNSAILSAATGYGKSYSSCYIIKELGQKTLFLVDRSNLVEQTYEEFSRNIKIGKTIILNSKNKNENADIYIATLQFLNKNPDVVDRLTKEIGFVIVDEVHIVSVGSLTQVITKFPAKYRLGMSATPSRSDGLTNAIYDHFTTNVIKGNGKILPVSYYKIQTSYDIWFSGKNDAAKAWENALSNQQFLDEITQFAQQLIEKEHRHILIYTTYQKSQLLTKALLQAKGIKAEIINASTKKKDREAILDRFKSGEKLVLISGTILQKGISIPIMDTIINIANHTKESLEQAMGRLRRENAKSKELKFFDFCLLGKGNYKCNLRHATVIAMKNTYNDKIIIWTYNDFLNAYKIKSNYRAFGSVTEIDLELSPELLDKMVRS